MVEIIPKPAKQLPSWEKTMTYFTFGLLIISVSAYFFLDNSITKAETKLQELERTLMEQKTEEEIVFEKEIFGYQAKIEHFSEIFKNHFYFSKILNFFEKVCHPKVWFSIARFTIKDYNLILVGKTTDFLTLEQQLSIFRKEPLIKAVDLSNLSVGKEGMVDFNLTLALDPEILK